jgi:asparagine synthase (glutamine-hydrolysing)
VQEGIDAVQDVIYHLETYDVTTIRAGEDLLIVKPA